MKENLDEVKRLLKCARTSFTLGQINGKTNGADMTCHEDKNIIQNYVKGYK